MIKLSNYQLIQGKVIKHPKGNILKTLDSKKLYGTSDIETISVDEVYNLI